MISKEALFHLIPRERRRWNRKVAKLFGYFWVSCPICKEDFAGFEWLENHTIQEGCYGRGVCYKSECATEAKRRSFFLPVKTRDNNGKDVLIYDPSQDPKLYSVTEVTGRIIWKYKERKCK